MPDLDPTTKLQLLGIALTFLAAIGVGFWRAKVNSGSDRDVVALFVGIGACLFLTLVQFIVLMVRLG